MISPDLFSCGLVSAAGGLNQCRAWSDGLHSVRRLVKPWVVGYAWARATEGLQLVMDPRGVRSASRQAKPQWRLPQGSAAPEAAFCLQQRSGLRPRERRRILAGRRGSCNDSVRAAQNSGQPGKGATSPRPAGRAPRGELVHMLYARGLLGPRPCRRSLHQPNLRQTWRKDRIRHSAALALIARESSRPMPALWLP